MRLVLPFSAQNPVRDSLSESLVDLSTDTANHQLTDEISGLGVCAAEGFLKWHSLCCVHADHVWRGPEPKDDLKAANQVEMCPSQCRI